MPKQFIPERLLSYVVASDRGLAPNVTDGICTLAVCKPLVRQAATPGRDWIVGVSTRAHGHDRVIYTMQVDEKISYEDYFRDPRFACKKPGRDMQGDNFFRLERGVYAVAFNTAAHAGKAEKIARDVKSPVVVIGRHFWYFGGEAPELPANLSRTAIAVPGVGRRGHRVSEDPATIKSFVQWISQYAPGKSGTPRDFSPAR